MSTITTGRTLDSDGQPIPDTGFELDPDGVLAERIADRTGPITSHPTRPVWGVPLEAPGDTIRTLSIVGPGYDGPPPHYHHQSEEVFDVRRGAITMTLDGTERRITAGESIRVDTGVTHTFSTVGDERAVVVTEIYDPGRLAQVLPTLGGLAHDEAGDPADPLQRALIADRLDGNTVFTDAEGGLRGALTNALAPVAALAGYQGAYHKYARPVFWRRNVEQPEF